MHIRKWSAAISVFLIVAFSAVLSIKEAHAYLDLGSGSYLIQLLLASVFMSLFTIKLRWHRLTAKVSQLLRMFRRVNIDVK